MWMECTGNALSPRRDLLTPGFNSIKITYSGVGENYKIRRHSMVTSCFFRSQTSLVTFIESCPEFVAARGLEFYFDTENSRIKCKKFQLYVRCCRGGYVRCCLNIALAKLWSAVNTCFHRCWPSEAENSDHD